MSMNSVTCNLERYTFAMQLLLTASKLLSFEVNGQESHGTGGSNPGRISVRHDKALAFKVLSRLVTEKV